MSQEIQNLTLYNKLRNVPDEAKKTIGAGRLKNMTDINPMWRIKTLTETFGVVGFGWKYHIAKMWTEAGANGVVSCFSHIELFVKIGDVWSDPIEGVGGSSFVAMEKSGAYTSDECYKMALTDAISVACKGLGIGADVYYAKDRTKFDEEQRIAEEFEEQQKLNDILEQVVAEMEMVETRDQLKAIWDNNPLLRRLPRFNEVKDRVKNIKGW